jgi:TatD DNase family protein
MTGPEGRARLVDSHAHLDMADFASDRREAVLRGFEAGLVGLLCPADLTRPGSLQEVLGLIREFPAILAAAGVHPHEAGKFRDDHLEELRRAADGGLIKAVGEIGLDFHYDFSPRDVQGDVLRRQLSWAGRAGLPVILHSRLTGPEIIAAVDGEAFTAGGILHCFTEDWPTARDMIDRGFYISFSGILTFPKAGALRDVAAKVPLDRLLVETDSPYLAPVPFRGSGRRCEPAYVVETAKVLAAVRGLPFPELAEATTSNFYRLFPFDNPGRRC